LFETRTDHRKIVGSAGAGHVSSLFIAASFARRINYTVRNWTARG
jgi:hypothetical protein